MIRVTRELKQLTDSFIKPKEEKKKETEGQRRDSAADLLLHHSALLMVELRLSTEHILKISVKNYKPGVPEDEGLRRTLDKNECVHILVFIFILCV